MSAGGAKIDGAEVVPMMEGHKETGPCRVCGRSLTSVPILFASYLTCNIADDEREGHTREELNATWLKG